VTKTEINEFLGRTDRYYARSDRVSRACDVVFPAYRLGTAIKREFFDNHFHVVYTRFYTSRLSTTDTVRRYPNTWTGLFRAVIDRIRYTGQGKGDDGL